MNKKQTVIGTLFAMAFIFGWFVLMNYVNTKWGDKLNKPADQQATAPAAPTTAPAGAVAAGAVGTPAAGTQPGGVGAAPVSVALQVIAAGEPTAAPASLGSAKFKDPTFALQLTTAPAGAGISSVVLNDFRETVDDKAGVTPYSFQHPDLDVQATYGNPLATRSITVDGVTVDVSRTVWRLESTDGTGRATYSITLGNGPAAPVVKVLKTYHVFDRKNAEHPGLGFEVRVDYDFENLSGRPIQVAMSYNGPGMPQRELDAGPDQRVMMGFRDGLNIAVENYYVESFSKDSATMELTKLKDDGKLPLYWVGASSVYFQAIVMPPVLENPDGGKTMSVASFKGINLTPNSDTKHPIALVADTTAMPIAAGHKLNYPVSVFFGPKWRDVLNKPFYASLPRNYDQTLVVRSGPCAMCTFDWLINVLVVMLGAFHTVTRDWGLAIICLVILVRLALHPITKKSQVSMMKMGKMGPEMKRLQEKYKDNKEELQKAMWEFQKQQGITPVLGCLPMFLQMPIWIALWSALNTTFELRHSGFLWGWTWIDDLAKPDRLIPFPTGWSFRLPLIGTVFDALNVLPLLLAVVFYLQQKYTPKPAAMTPEQEQQQKIMQWMMVLLFPLFLYGQPSGLNLYILTSTGIGIWESKRIRRHIKEKEEAEKAGIVIVDAEPAKPEPGGKGKRKEPLNIGGKGPKGGGGGGKGAATAAPGPQGWLARKLAELQEKAEQARRAGERRGRDRA